MGDVRKNIDVLESAAAECDLVFQLALSEDVRRQNAELSAAFLERQGHSTEQARRLLAILEDTLALFEANRDHYWRHES